MSIVAGFLLPNSVSVLKHNFFYGHSLFRAPKKHRFCQDYAQKKMTLKVIVNCGSIARSDFCFVFFFSFAFPIVLLYSAVTTVEWLNERIEKKR